MEFEQINLPESIVQQIDHEGQFADIIVDIGNGNNIYSQKVLIHKWSSNMTEEINMERARYLISTDEMLEEWHSCKD
jgi:hypothetical protein